MNTPGQFFILDTVDSTNNYAMDRIREGVAAPGMAWFSHTQTAGKGQRGRVWISAPGQNMALSLVLEPPKGLDPGKFHLNARVALSCLHFLQNIHPTGFSLKWPNDLYWNDRKAGGILIERIFSGQTLKWVVVGVGININQGQFPPEAGKAVSLKEISGKDLSPEALARELHEKILSDLSAALPAEIMPAFNRELYKKGLAVQMKKDNMLFTSVIKEVDEYGRLITTDNMDRAFSVGEVEWI